MAMSERIVSREVFNNAIADEAAQSCVDWSNPERRKEALRYIVKQIWDEALTERQEPPVIINRFHEHNYFYQSPYPGRETGFYYCLCGWEGPDRESYWKHLPIIDGRWEVRPLAEAKSEPTFMDALKWLCKQGAIYSSVGQYMTGVSLADLMIEELKLPYKVSLISTNLDQSAAAAPSSGTGESK